MYSLLKKLASRSLILLTAAAALATAPVQASLHIDTENKDANHIAVRDIPDSLGRAGMAAGVMEDADKTSVVYALGGANFPQAQPGAKTPEERGEKIFYSDIYKLKDGQWIKIGNMPEPVAYAAFGESPDGLIVAGGANASGHLDKVWLIHKNDGTVSNCEVTALPPLPTTVAYAACVTRNNRLYVIGGQEKPESATALDTVYMLDMTAKPDKREWKKMPAIPGGGRILSTAAHSGSYLYLIGGCSLAPDAQGKPARTYLDGMLAFDETKGEWTDKKLAPVPAVIAASPSPAPARENKILHLGGDARGNGNTDAMPQQSSQIYSYDILENTWEKAGNWPVGIATAPVVVMGKDIITVSGETAPGIRTPAVVAAGLGYSFELTVVDYIVFTLVAIVLIILIVQTKTKGFKNIAIVTDPHSKPGRYAWVLVGLLWIVVMLNYFDRQLLSALYEPIVRDIPQTKSQFGMVTSVFLLIYALLSPVGGFLADRYSRRLVILGSLVVWSAVTWLTGHVHDYTTLLIARGFMGVSEACYIPAALALITDYHKGSTRSLAVGIHMSGIYAGMALAGYGGTMAEIEGWRMTFALFGLVGVAYAFVLIVFLKDPSKNPAQDIMPSEALEETRPVNVTASSGSILKSLLSIRSMWMLMGIVAFSGAANWFLLTWYPTLLQEKYNLSTGEAGPMATQWSSLAKYIAVIGGAIIADRWYMKNARARALVPGIAFSIAGPLIVLALVPSIFGWGFQLPLALIVVFISTQGLAQGCMDATLMPVLRSHIDERYSATGYGILNLASAGIGAMTSFFGGWLADRGIPLTTSLALAGVLMFLGGIFFLLLPKPSDPNS